MRSLWTEQGKAAPPDTLFQLLWARQMHDVERAKRYLRPKPEHLVPAAALTDLERAADRIAAALRKGETIIVHGDYDVDGICSTALLTKVLRAGAARLGSAAQVLPFIPDRRADGYDLGPAGVAFAKVQGASLVVTCDCGTTALEPARALRAAGVDLIVTDHHRPGPQLPEAYALVNPQREADVETRDDQYLAAVGVAWKLATAIAERVGVEPELVDDQLELVALATVADVAPLRGDNRWFVAEGLRRMQGPSNGQRDRRNVGLRALIRSASLDDRRLTAGRLGFVVAPRLNALGRIRKALTGVELLLTDDESRAMDLAAECNAVNDERQAMDREILLAAQGMLPADLDPVRGLVIAGDGWEPGVIGIVASRIVEMTHRPTFLIAVTEDGGRRLGKGSGRSIPGFDLHAALTACGDLLIKYGGHRAAAGLTIEPDAIPEFRRRFDAAAREQLGADPPMPELRPDLELPINAADEGLVKVLRHLEPFGVGNPGPVFLSRDVPLAGRPRTINGDSIKLQLAVAQGPREAIGWQLAGRLGSAAPDARVDMLYRLEVNEFRGARTLQANLVDLRPSEG